MRLIFIFIVALFLSTFNALPANAPEATGNVLTGKVVDSNNNIPVEYANIAVYSKEGSLITGGITDSQGAFTIKDLKPGEYFIVAKFIGYDELKIENLLINQRERTADIGTIKLLPSVSELDGVDVVAERKAVMYKIDKKVVSPSQYLAASGGTAADILANTPSVTVDVEGNVSLRGSSNFTVLIDGRPTPFEASDALQQVPASQIENIEIITNPSAKYDPDGTAGIINIITKRNRLNGLNGIINVDANSIGSVNGDFLLNLRRDKFNFYIGGNRSDRKGEGSFFSKTEITRNDTIFNTQQKGSGGRGFGSNSLKTGFNYNFNQNTTLTLNLSGGTQSRRFFNESENRVFKTVGSSAFDEEITDSENDNSSGGYFFSGDIGFEKKFKKEGHKIQSLFFYEFSDRDENNVTERQNPTLFDGLKSWEADKGNEFRFQTDYTLPVNSFLTIEAGYLWRYDVEDSWYDLFIYSDRNAAYEPNSNSSYYKTTDYFRHIHAGYMTFAGEVGKFGYKGGLRSEYTLRQLTFSASPQPYKIDRIDFFPSIHLSYQLPHEIQLMTSYSRRIERPRGYYLEPFDTWMDAYNVRRGDPGIEPEYINSFELGAQKTFTKGFLSFETFYRETQNRIDRIQSVYITEQGDTADNIILMTSANAGTDYALGVEGMLNYEFTKWWSTNLNGSLFNYRVKGEVANVSFDRESRNWSMRFSNTFKPATDTRVQFDIIYNSPSLTAQGSREGFVFSNLAVRQDFLKRRLSATLSVQDLFDTAKFGMVNEGPNFKSERKFDLVSPIVQLQLSFKINNYSPDRKKGGEGEGGGMDMEGGF